MTPSPSNGWDLNTSLAEIHERYLVPAIYAQWAIRLTAMAHIDDGHHVLDVGCGTGILARKASEDAGFTGKVVGVDIDAEMLKVAARSNPAIEWRQGDATDLPFEDATFDRVVSQFTLPHVKNRVAALKEQRRVLKPGGRLLLAVWAPLSFSPAFKMLVDITRQYAGVRAANALAMPWELGPEHKLRALLAAAGLDSCSISQQKGTSRFPNPQCVVDLWIQRGTARELITEQQLERIGVEAGEALEAYSVGAGGMVCPMDATVAVAKKGDG